MSEPANTPATADSDANPVHFHKDFFTGLLDDKKTIVDFRRMSDPERAALVTWVVAIVNRASHRGKNKESWKANGETPAYEKSQLWHYHCGPSYAAKANAALTAWDLPSNDRGLASDEIIHYSKKRNLRPGDALRFVTVLGFSRQHDPFLEEGDPGNPLLRRARTIQDSMDAASLTSRGAK